MGIRGNETAEQLARNGANTPFRGPEPVLRIIKGTVSASLGDWLRRVHDTIWKDVQALNTAR